MILMARRFNSTCYRYYLFFPIRCVFYKHRYTFLRLFSIYNHDEPNRFIYLLLKLLWILKKHPFKFFIPKTYAWKLEKISLLSRLFHIIQSVYYNYSIMEKLIKFQIFTINIFPLLKINQKRLRRIIKLLVYRNIT